MSKPQRLLVAAGLIISVVFLAFAFKDLQPAEVLANIRAAKPLPILVGAVVYFAAVTVISQRWGWLLRAIQSVSLKNLVPLVSIGYMGNNIYPFRAGEILRVWLLQRNHAVPFARGATTAVVERIFDGLVMLTFIVVSLLLLDITSQEVHDVATFAAPIFLAGLVVFFALAARPDWLRRIAGIVSKVLPGKLGEFVSSITNDLISGMDGLRSPVDLALTILFSYLSWAIEAGVYWIVTFAFDLNMTYVDMLLVMAVVNLAGLLPASPGMFGVFEFFASAVLIAEGAPPEIATAYALVVHMVIWLPVTLVGFFFLARQGLGWKAITHARDLENRQPIPASE
jgi:hypothetical protein